MACVDFIKLNYLCTYIFNTLHSYGSMETDLFCECLEHVVNDCSLVPKQTDPLYILEPWKQLVAIDKGKWYVIILFFKCYMLYFLVQMLQNLYL